MSSNEPTSKQEVPRDGDGDAPLNSAEVTRRLRNRRKKQRKREKKKREADIRNKENLSSQEQTADRSEGQVELVAQGDQLEVQAEHLDQVNESEKSGEHSDQVDQSEESDKDEQSKESVEDLDRDNQSVVEEEGFVVLDQVAQGDQLEGQIEHVAQDGTIDRYIQLGKDVLSKIF